MKLKLIVIGLLAALAFSRSAAASAETVTVGGRDEPSKSKAVVVILDRLSWPELAEADPPNLRRLAGRGSIGLLSNHTASTDPTPGDFYLTLASGSRAIAGTAGARPIDLSTIRRLSAKNGQTGYRAKAGLLASRLRTKGVKAAVIGNADFRGPGGRPVLGREALLLGADDRGRVFFNQTSGRLLKSSRNSRVFSDFDKMAAAFDTAVKKARFLAIETGDSRRVDAVGRGRSLAPVKKRAIFDADRFIGRLIKRLDFKHDLLMVVTPSAPTEGKSPGKALTPVIVRGPGFNHGRLSSPSTRRPGLVAGTDVAPTIAAFFGVDLAVPVNGRAMTSIGGRWSFQGAAREAEALRLAENLSVPVIVIYSSFQGFLLVFVVLGLIFAANALARFRHIVRLSLLASMTMPLAIFAAGAVPYSLTSAPAYLAAILALTFLVTLFVHRLSPDALSALPLAAGLTTAFLVANVLLGSLVDNKSAFGYTAISAGRFYGIGNHYLSILVPAAIIWALLSSRRVGGRPLALFFAGLVFVIGHGQFGANTGGTIMAASAFSLAWLGLRRKKLLLYHAVAALAASLFSFGLMAAIDSFYSSPPTHLGLLAERLYAGSLGDLGETVARKLALNAAAFNYSLWSYAVILIGLALIAWYIISERRSIQWAVNRHANAMVVFKSVLAGGLIGSVVNDSGISILALVLGYLLMALLYLEVCDRYGGTNA